MVALAYVREHITMFENAWFISIVSGVISTIIGGVVLHAMGRFTGPSRVDNVGVLLLRLSIFGIFTVVIFAIIFGDEAIPPGGLSFGMPGVDPIIRGLLFIFGEILFLFEIVLGIEIFRK